MGRVRMIGSILSKDGESRVGEKAQGREEEGEGKKKPGRVRMMGSDLDKDWEDRVREEGVGKRKKR